MKIAIIGKSGTNSSVQTDEFLRTGWVVKTLARNSSMEAEKVIFTLCHFNN